VIENAYMTAYSVPPIIALPALIGESASGTYTSPCGSGKTTVDLQVFSDCPLPLPAGEGNHMNGKYTAGAKAIDFTCSATVTGSGGTETVTNSGSLTATDPIPCGLWTADCPISGPPSAVRTVGVSPAARSELAVQLARTAARLQTRSGR
jgi:hypothetical protein